MTHIEFVIAKALVLLLLAVIWGLFCGFTGRSLSGEPDEPPQTPPKK